MKKTYAFGLAAGSAAAAAFLYWSDKALETTEYCFASTGVPEAFDGTRIAQVSDLQSTWFGAGQEKLIRAVAAQRPDYIAVTGDLLDRNHTDEMAAMTAIERLTAIAPVYYCNGNHEVSLPPTYVSQIYDALRNLRVEVLLDRMAVIERGRDRLYWIGISEETLYAAKEAAAGGSTGRAAASDPLGTTAEPFMPRRTDTAYDPSVICDAIADLTAGIPEDEFAILLAHEPQFLDTYAEAGEGKIDLIFSGHAHGGQIRLPFTEGLFAPGQGILPKLTSGMHTSDESTMIISRGLGNSIFPFRVFNRPEIVVCQLHRVE